MKNVWVTALDRDEKSVQTVLGTIKRYGLGGNGHFWEDDLKHLSWMGPREVLSEKDTALWVLVCSPKSFESETVRYGLSLLTIAVQAKRGLGFPILLATSGAVDVGTLPTPLRGADNMDIGSTSFGAKMVAKANTPVPNVPADYHINLHANPAYGTWFEVGPASGSSWKGALFGVCGGEIDFHGVGPSGILPQKSVLEYPMQGIKLALGEKEYNAWAVQNTLDGETSYYVRIRETPKSIIFGPFAQDDEASVNSIAFV